MCVFHILMPKRDFSAVKSESTSVTQLEKRSYIRNTFLCIYFCYLCVTHFETTGLLCVCVCVCKRNSISNYRHLPVKESWTRTDSMQETQENNMRVTYEYWTIMCHVHIKTSFNSILTNTHRRLCVFVCTWARHGHGQTALWALSSGNKSGEETR